MTVVVIMAVMIVVVIVVCLVETAEGAEHIGVRIDLELFVEDRIGLRVQVGPEAETTRSMHLNQHAEDDIVNQVRVCILNHCLAHIVSIMLLAVAADKCRCICRRRRLGRYCSGCQWCVRIRVEAGVAVVAAAGVAALAVGEAVHGALSRVADGSEVELRTAASACAVSSSFVAAIDTAAADDGTTATHIDTVYANYVATNAATAATAVAVVVVRMAVEGRRGRNGRRHDHRRRRRRFVDER